MLNLSLYTDYLKARLGTDERGAAAVEYGLVVAMVAAVIAGAIWAFGDRVDDFLTNTVQLDTPPNNG